MSDESSSSQSSNALPANFASDEPRLSLALGRPFSFSNPLQSPSPPISPANVEAAPLLVSARPLSPPLAAPLATGSGARQSYSSRSRPVVPSPLNPSMGPHERVASSGGEASSTASSKNSHEDRIGSGSGTEEFYYAPPGLSRYSAASHRLSGVDQTLMTDLSFHESGSETPLYEGSFVRPFGQSGTRPSSASLYSLATGEDAKANMLKTATTTALLWDDEKNAEADDWIHNPIAGEPDTTQRRAWSNRGAMNLFGMLLVLGGIIALFITWPIVTFVVNGPRNSQTWGAFNIGGINGTGQIPQVLAAQHLIDADTPQSAYTKTDMDGNQYNLVFSDEFDHPGRTFWPGDDPFWEAVSLNYWATGNYEWLDPEALVTKNGNLEITITEQPTHGFNFRSGMIQSWNKFCFSDNAYIEVNLSMPGTPTCQGFWPAAWTMGNLARAGFGATNEGMWPYSYNSCDVGTQPNQTNVGGTTPVDAKTTGSHDYGGELSWLPGQRVSACTCAGEDHPGPSNNVGRGGPEIDIIEAQVNYQGYGTASQSMQLAPFDASYAWNNSTTGMFIENAQQTVLNTYKGSITQEAASAVTQFGSSAYDGNAFATFAYSYKGGSASNSKITWYVNGQPSWGVNAAAFAANSGTQVGQRLISVEPMFMILNLGLSPKFQTVQFDCLQFPSTMYIDYIRVYQQGTPQVGCDPSNYPTAQYIQDHIDLYTNPNLTSFTSKYPWPKNSRQTSC